MKKNQKKAILKTISWRIISSAALFIISYYYTDSMTASTSLTAADAVIKTIIYYFHELAWQGKMKKRQ